MSTDRLATRLQGGLLAACITLAPLLLGLSFAVDPTGGVPGGTDHIFASFRAASALHVQYFLWTNAVATFVFAPSYIGLGLLARRASPLLATIGMALGLVGSLPWGVFIEAEALAYHLATAGGLVARAGIWEMVSSEGAVGLLFLAWIIGHLAGYVVLAVALWRAQAIPRWASALILCVVIQGASYVTGNGLFQVVAFAAVFAGSVPAAAAMWRSSRSQESPPSPSAA
jgi:hypothetical protein